MDLTLDLMFSWPAGTSEPASLRRVVHALPCVLGSGFSSGHGLQTSLSTNRYQKSHHEIIIDPVFFLFKIPQCNLIVKCFVAILPLDRDESLEVFVGDVTSYTLHNLLPGTTYDVQVFAQYDGGVSKPLTGQGTTCTFSEISFF